MPSLNHSLNAIWRCGTVFRGDRLEGTGVGPYNYFYLFYICRHPGVSQETLAKALFVNKSSVTRHLTHLESEGFLTRTPDPEDRRVLLVHPTDKANALLPFLREVGQEWRAALTDGFTDAETAQFEALLEKALQNAKKHANGGEIL
ncbi:MAG: MarR family transcriptional regulator [Clostridia bacterium]|nr:MarR family transcriptional regulator [Clostridia bacterium]